MDLKKWAEEDWRKAHELTSRCLDKLARGQKIDLFEDLVVEFKDLKGKNYAMWVPVSTPVAEEHPCDDLGTLLNSCLYDHILVPIHRMRDKATFTYEYGLSENRGCRVNFNQFLNFIRSGKLKPFLTESPEYYSPRFYEQIFKACEQQREGYLPSLMSARVEWIFAERKLEAIAYSEGIPLTEDWVKMTEKRHPEYDIKKCCEEIAKICSGKCLEKLMGPFDETRTDVYRRFGSFLNHLRTMGFEGLAEVCLSCLRLEPYIGRWVFGAYYDYLISPTTMALLGFKNYDKQDVDSMLFLRLIAEDLAMGWKELLSSSPAAFSVGSPQVYFNTLELSGNDLVRFVEAHPEKELKSSVKRIGISLAEFDVHNAMKDFRRFDEIVTERYNKEIRALSIRARVIHNTLRFGKSFLNRAASLGASFLGAAMAATGQFQWLPAIFGGAVGAKYAEYKLSEIKAEDVVKWWSTNWPFSDPGLPFVLWEHILSKKTQQN